MLIDNTEIYGFRRALYGMRNPKNSWDKSDSLFWGTEWGDGTGVGISINERPCLGNYFCPECPSIGPKDLTLMHALVKAGGDHRKFLRHININADLTLPRYIWQELDTYKVGTVRNSCSTMHKLGFKDLEMCDFQNEAILPAVLKELNILGEMYRNFLSANDSESATVTLRALKRHLPEGFLQKSTYSLNYEVALRIYYARVSHRMEEWSGEGGLCQWIHNMPHMEGIICAARSNK